MDSHALFKSQLARLAGDLKIAIAEQKSALPSPMRSLWQCGQLGSKACEAFSPKQLAPTLQRPQASSFEKPQVDFSSSQTPSDAQKKSAPTIMEPVAIKKETPTIAEPTALKRVLTESTRPPHSKEEDEFEKMSNKQKETKKVGSFTLESPPPPLTYDLQGPEKWFQGKGVQKTSHQIDGTILKGRSSKSAKLPPILILYPPQSLHLESLEKLQGALTRSFMSSSCVSDSPSIRSAIIDAIECKRLHLLLIAPDFKEDDLFLAYSLTRKIETMQLEEPARKLELWKWISQHLSKSTLP